MWLYGNRSPYLAVNLKHNWYIFIPESLQCEFEDASICGYKIESDDTEHYAWSRYDGTSEKTYIPAQDGSGGDGCRFCNIIDNNIYHGKS